MEENKEKQKTQTVLSAATRSVAVISPRQMAISTDEETRTFRLRTLRAFLGSGITPAKIDKMAGYLESAKGK